ncbi:BREX-1 system adenine-specific DNA-methyltransferase PglX [Sinorhizobium meliloti]
MRTVFLRVLEAEDKANALLEAVREPASSGEGKRYEIETSSFSAMPGNTFSYWAGPSALACYERFSSLKSTKFVALSTNQLSDDPRYARLWWEVGPSAVEQWVSWAKGRTFAPYHFDIQTLVRWNARRQTYTGFLGTEHRPLEKPASADWFFRPGLTWPRRSNQFSVSVLPTGCVFGNKGPAIFAEGDNLAALLALAAVLNSRIFKFLLSLQTARVELAQSFEVGLVQDSPIPDLTQSINPLSDLAFRAWAHRRSLDTSVETSHNFTIPALLQVRGDSLTTRTSEWASLVRETEVSFAAIEADIESYCFDLYGIGESDRRLITRGVNFSSAATDELPATTKDISSNDDLDGTDDADDDSSAASLAAQMTSWAVGVALSRFDVRLATGDRRLSTEPGPFDALPASSPAMLSEPHDLPSSSPPIGYPIAIAKDGILVDDPGHRHDLTAVVRSVFQAVFTTQADKWWNDVGKVLEPKSHDLRVWLVSSFFEHHLKRYSKSRRKAPIIWQIAVPSGRYSVWLYSHRLTSDSFFQIQNDVVTPKLAHEERQFSDLVQSAGSSPSAKERKEIRDQEAFVEELRSLLDEVKRVAPLWNPVLDDGIQLTMAPLWKLVPQHRAWQKELKAKWDELANGKYDWAHIAMHLWPERVVPKCATDRSLAIAHGLEDIFWIEGDDGKWKPRLNPTRPVSDLVQERTSAAVKAALLSLSEAATPVAARTRARRSA